MLKSGTRNTDIQSPDDLDRVVPTGAARGILLRLFPSIMLPMYLAMVDATIVVTALPTIAAKLGDPQYVPWVMVAYLVTSMIAAPVYGRIGDHFGLRKLMFIALALFMVTSVLCAISTSVPMLIIARAMHGMGGGGLMTLSQALVGEVVQPRQRGRMQGYLATVAISASTIGPVAGGFLTEYVGWQSVFLVNIPIALIAVPFLLRLTSHPRPSSPFRFDFPGLVLLALCVTSILLLLHQVRFLPHIDIPAVSALLVANIATAVLLVRREMRASDPLIPIVLLRKAAIWRCDALAACHGAILVSLMTFLPIYLRVTHGMTASEIGIAMIPMSVGVGIGSMVVGRLMSQTGKTATFPRVGMPVVTFALVIIALWSPEASAWAIRWAFAIAALFMGTVMTVVQVVVQAEAGPGMRGSAAGSVQFSRTLGAAFGTALVGAVLFAALAMQSQDMADLFGEVLRNGPEILQSLPADQSTAIAGNIAIAFRTALLTIAGIGVLGSVLAWTLPDRQI